MSRKTSYFSLSISSKEAQDSGMAVALIFLLIGFFTGKLIFYKIAIPFLIMDMIYPMFYYYFAFIWFGLSKLLGTFFSRVLLVVVFYFIVFPIGGLRRVLGKDTLRLKEFKKSKASVLITRNIRYTVREIEKPY